MRKQREKDVLQSMSSNASALSLQIRPEIYPDFAGQFLHHVGEALFVAMPENDVETVTELFPDFFNNSLLQFNRLLGSTVGKPDWQATMAMKVAVAPVLDLMNLTGYCILFSELHGNPQLCKRVRDVWDAYFAAKTKEGKPVLRFLQSAVELTESAFELAHRSMIRSNWKLQVAHALQSVKRKQTMVRGAFITETTILHQSPIVRIFARSELGSPYDGIDIFFEEIMRKQPDSGKIKLDARRSSFHESLVRETKKIIKAEEDDGDQA